MSGKLLTINIIYAITDTLIAALCICGFGWAAFHFDRWWILCFTVIPLFLFNSHSMIFDADIDAARNGGETDAG